MHERDTQSHLLSVLILDAVVAARDTSAFDIRAWKDRHYLLSSFVTAVRERLAQLLYTTQI